MVTIDAQRAPPADTISASRAVHARFACDHESPWSVKKRNGHGFINILHECTYLYTIFWKHHLLKLLMFIGLF